jgi:hypothetical protein
MVNVPTSFGAVLLGGLCASMYNLIIPHLSGHVWFSLSSALPVWWPFRSSSTSKCMKKIRKGLRPWCVVFLPSLIFCLPTGQVLMIWWVPKPRTPSGIHWNRPSPGASMFYTPHSYGQVYGFTSLRVLGLARQSTVFIGMHYVPDPPRLKLIIVIKGDLGMSVCESQLYSTQRLCQSTVAVTVSWFFFISYRWHLILRL